MTVDDQSLQRAAEVIQRARLVAISSGAGISKESGVPTFRDAQEGLWAKYDPEQLATPAAFRRDPNLVWSWYMFRTSLVANAQPNPGHRALVELEALVPEVVILTQNVDGLHAQAGSRHIVELHGRLGRFKCFEACQGEPTIVDLASVPYEAERAPACPHCQTGLLRPDVVWFGEALPEAALQRAFEVAKACDVMLVIGTSGIVQPAAALPYYACSAGAAVIEVNPEPSLITKDVDMFLQGPSGVVLPRLVQAVRACGGAD